MTYINALVLSREAKQRFKWLKHYEKFRNARLTCRHFGISADTFYLWKKRFNPSFLPSLEDDKSNRRPKVLRRPKYTKSHIETIRKLRENNPRVGKIFITKVLKEKGLKTSSATVGRILRTIKAGVDIEP